MTDSTETLGQRLRRARINLKKSQVEVASTVGCSQRAISNWESGKFRISKKHIKKVSEVLEIPTDEIKHLAAKWAPSDQQVAVVTKKDYITINILPLMKTICNHTENGSAQIVTIADIRFLLETQQNLPAPMSGALIVELLKNRHAEK